MTNLEKQQQKIEDNISSFTDNASKILQIDQIFGFKPASDLDSINRVISVQNILNPIHDMKLSNKEKAQMLTFFI